MKEYYKNPNFYYIAIPAIIALWALTTWTLSLPAAQSKLDRKRKESSQSEEYIAQILEFDPDRLEYETQKGKDKEFDYLTAVEWFARKQEILPSNYLLQSRLPTERRGRKTKSADITIKSIDIERFSKFLSAMLLRWPDLQCEQLKLTKLPEGPDAWKATMKLTYYY